MNGLLKLLSLVIGAVFAGGLGGTAVAQEPQHFSPKGKMPSQYTIEAQQQQRQLLPFADKRDFEEAKRGFIAAPPFRQIMNDKGDVAWNMDNWDFLLKGMEFDSIHPSLQRQALLNMEYGLFEVVPGIYQIRGFDLANISFIKGDTGWIVIDPLTVKETARAALKFINEKLGERPVVAVIISHSHGDHFGGIRGVVDDAALAAEKVQIIAPKGFLNEAIAENLYAGNVMTRRKSYTYGDLVPPSPYGHVDASIGKAVASGDVGILPPTISIDQPIQELTIDGVRMVFQNTPGTEAPAEMNTWFPDFKAFWAAENIVGSLHNILTLRGAPVRDALAWSQYINLALYQFGNQADVMFASHSWPRWGKERITEVMRGQRDMYANLNNQVLHLANKGVTINQIHNVYEPPKSLQQQWHSRGYHGSYLHNSRAVIQRYLGFWDLNPATLVPLSPEESAPLYVEMMGGGSKVMAKGRDLYAEGKYRLATEILNKLVYAEPDNQEAKDLLADTYEQMGYQFESPSLRHSFLAGAKELRDGVVAVKAAKAGSPDFVRGTSTELFLNYLGIQMESGKAEGMTFKINLSTPDNGEKFVLEMSNATLTTIAGYQAEDADLTVTIDRRELEDVMIGTATLSDKVSSGKAKMEGNPQVLAQLGSTMVMFDNWFEVLPGTKKREALPKPELFQDDATRYEGP
ncbi:alkyl/aryl-sulfatase [Sinorhizobium medicae]|uniref:Beta-lactamase domain protein n=4 Tax=Sinorhizobium medicae TaxID=110321 RepID=A0A508WT96_9HYPH|nr:alkyl sulfatase dimerization domain-containing protein [Sinorhizobium medicae]ABR60206.1 beta-lactamase domain protein [Sinorhizobium medicae WSM419]MBO1962279.1 MBL fold metallo-hydrolase [Sinorhizobium medicae]MDX0426325.1 MBL fold metallo-hydrolase [Sinorhizobium medicae]MDX0439010.1 MBL fold metallo-hydrolase [Sinorhizobium medicae]MDX0449153.1 MBL fold metallo-hydrolase [Sinorhizobium medicae]